MAVRLADIQKKQQPKATGGLQDDKGHAARSLQAFRTPLPSPAAEQHASAKPITTDNKVVIAVVAKPATETDNNRQQSGPKPITETDNNRQQVSVKPVTTDNKAVEVVPKPITETDNNRQQVSVKPVATDNKAVEVVAKPVTVIGSDDDCYRLKGDLLSVSPPQSGPKPITVIGSSPVCYRNEPVTETGNNRQQQSAKPVTGTDNNRQQQSMAPALPSGHQQLQLLELLERHQRGTGLNHTPRLKRGTIALEMGTTAGVIAMQINRLCDKGYVGRESVSVGRGSTAGTVYKVSPNVIRALRQRNRQQEPITTGNSLDINQQQEPITIGNKNRQQRGGSSSSFKSTPTNLDDSGVEQAEELQLLINCFALDDEQLRVGANDLLTAFRAQSSSFEAFARSVEHAAFYLRKSPDAKSIRHAKAWMMKTLREGYYAAPAGFISREEEQKQAELADNKARLARLMAVRKEVFMTAFEVWKLELAPADVTRLLGGSFVTPSSAGAESILREKFAEQTGQQKTLAYFSSAEEA